jgi:hypothetical protein
MQITWDYLFAGTAPATVDVRLEGNNIDINQASAWVQVDQGTNAAGEAARSVVNKEFQWLRIRFVASTGQDATSTVTAGIKIN